MSIKEFLSSGEYLPPILRDFHKQKDLFKLIDVGVQKQIEKEAFTKLTFSGYNWLMAHCYVIDHFLWFMAKHGYTLQKSRKDVAFIKLEHSLASLRNVPRETNEE